MTVADKTFTQPFDIIPEAVSGQALGDAGHVWDFYGGDADFEGHIAAGAGATVQAQTIADFSETYSGVLAGNYYGLEFRVALEPNANFGSTHIGLIGNVRLNTAWVQTGGTTEGIRGTVTIANTIAGTLRNARAANFYVDIEDGACATAVGVRVAVPYVDGGSITDAYGVYIREGAIGGGAITTQYGLYIEDMTNAGTNWSIYSAGGDSYHAGNFGIATATAEAQLDVSYGGMTILMGADLNAATRTNVTTKYSRLTSYHYTNIEEPVANLFTIAGVTTNLLYVGGGTASANAATEIRFYTAANSTTTIGTQRMVVDSGGDVGVGVATPAARLHVDNDGAVAQPVLYLDQGDVSEEMIQFATTIGVGNAIEAVGGKVLTYTHYIKVTIPGALTRYIPCGTIA